MMPVINGEVGVAAAFRRQKGHTRNTVYDRRQEYAVP